MNFVEYGKENKGSIILLHGGGLNSWNFSEVAEILCEEYHVILPVLDGHAGSDYPFTSIEDNADRIIAYIDEKHSGCVDFICGVSLGGQIALEILAKRGDICRYAVIESALTVPMKLTNLLIKPMMYLSYPLIKMKWFSKLQFRYLRINEKFFDDYYRDTCAISKQDMTAILKANSSYSLKDDISGTSAICTIIAGGKESRKIIRSAKMLSEVIEKSELIIINELYHGEYSLKYAKEYATDILEILA